MVADRAFPFYAELQNIQRPVQSALRNLGRIGLLPPSVMWPAGFFGYLALCSCTKRFTASGGVGVQVSNYNHTALRLIHSYPRFLRTTVDDPNLPIKPGLQSCLLDWLQQLLFRTTHPLVCTRLVQQRRSERHHRRSAQSSGWKLGEHRTAISSI